MFDYDTLSYSTDKVYSEIFDGFFFFAAVIGLIIALLVVKGRYKKEQTLGRRKCIKALSILLTVFDSLLLIIKIDIFAFLYNPYDYFKNGFFGSKEFGDTTMTIIYFTAYAVFILTIIIGIAVCVAGYRTLSNKQWTQNAYKNSGIIPSYKGIGKYCAVCGRSIGDENRTCPRCASTEFAENGIPVCSATNNDATASIGTAPVCRNCGSVNEIGALFCSQCGTSLK